VKSHPCGGLKFKIEFWISEFREFREVSDDAQNISLNSLNSLNSLIDDKPCASAQFLVFAAMHNDKPYASAQF
jgi:hypothetical protein